MGSNPTSPTNFYNMLSNNKYHKRIDDHFNKFWYLNGNLHREDVPAVEYVDGYKSWYIDGKRHRTDGPAIERVDGSKCWCLQGFYFTEQEWQDKVLFDEVKINSL